jgi:hypothetical protein
MYGGKVLGATTVAGGGAVILPNTGGNTLLTVVSIISITIGSVILLSTLVRFAAKKAYKA